MKKAQLIAFGISATVAVVAFVAVSKMTNKPAEVKVVERTVDTTEVLVASRNIVLGQVMSDADMTWQKWPKDAARSTFITSDRPDAKRKLAGSIARAPMLAGETITQNKLIKAGQGGVLAAILKRGMRAVATSIRQRTAVGGLVLPNDHVDVILTQEQVGRAGKSEFVSDTLFRNVRVLAIGQQIEAKEGKKSADSSGGDTTATLELSPRQAELLAQANRVGTITLTLRSVADLNKQKGTETGDGLSSERGSAVDILRYGVKSRAFGVN